MSAATPAPYLPFASLSMRTSPSLIVLAAVHIGIGSYLLVCGRRFWRLTCAVCLGLAAEWVAFAVLVNLIGDGGLNPSFSRSENDASAVGVILSAFVLFATLSLLLPKRAYVGWWLGWISLGLLAGASVGVTMLILHDGPLLIAHQARWALVGGLALLTGAILVFTNFIGAILCASLVGAFLLALGVDLLVNTSRGAAHGLRVLLDRQGPHREALEADPYNPPLSMQLLFGLSLLLALIAAGVQLHVWGQLPFLRLGNRMSAIEIDHRQHTRGCWPLGGKRSRSDRSRDMQQVHHTGDPSDMSSPRVLLGTFTPNSRHHSAGGRSMSMPSTARSPSTLHTATPSLADSEAPTDADLRSLTQNYQRALAALEAGYQTRGSSVLSSSGGRTPGLTRNNSALFPDTALGSEADDGGTTVRTTAVPIFYRPSESPVHMLGRSTSPPIVSPRAIHSPTRIMRLQSSAASETSSQMRPTLYQQGTYDRHASYRATNDGAVGGFVDPTEGQQYLSPRVYGEPALLVHHNSPAPDPEESQDAVMAMQAPSSRRQSAQLLYRDPQDMTQAGAPVDGFAAQTVPSRGRALMRAESDRGTTYSVAMTNITHSEYAERDRARPPSWVGDLPWHPSMLRSPLDPRTLPAPAEDTPPPDVRQAPDYQQYSPSRPPTTTIAASPVDVPPPPAAVLQSQQYASRPGGESEELNTNTSRSRGGSGTGGIGLLTRLSPTNGSFPSQSSPNGSRIKLRTSRTQSRDASMFPADDDLPDEADHSSDNNHTFYHAGSAQIAQGFATPSIDGHSRTNSFSQTSYAGLSAAFLQVPNQLEDANQSSSSVEFFHPMYAQEATSYQGDVDIQALPPPRRPNVIHRESVPVSYHASINESGSGSSNKPQTVSSNDYAVPQSGRSMVDTLGGAQMRTTAHPSGASVGALPLGAAGMPMSKSSTPSGGRARSSTLENAEDAVHAGAIADVAAAVEAGLIRPAPSPPNAIDKVLSRTQSQQIGQDTAGEQKKGGRVRFFESMTGRTHPAGSGSDLSAGRTSRFRSRLRSKDKVQATAAIES